jgi:hypothetical protein
MQGRCAFKGLQSERLTPVPTMVEGERCRADTLLIGVKPADESDFSANTDAAALTSQLDVLLGRGGNGHPTRCHEGWAKVSEERLEEPCLLIAWGAREHPYQQEDSSHGA